MENLQTLTENYLEYCRTQKCLDEKTLKAYRIDLRQFSEEPSLEKIIEITTNDLEDYIARLHQQYKPKTVKRKIASIKAFFHSWVTNFVTYTIYTIIGSKGKFLPPHYEMV